jgi:hypothetical protein
MKLLDSIQPGQRVRVKQTIRLRDKSWSNTTEGVVVSCGSAATGSWYAHGKHDKYWLPRIRLRLDDGELVDLALDEDTEIVGV